ncbi:MAG TPA: hypothetical protein VLT51_12310 [Anaerolineales bacterium]|nr:hypothetical protein [Anaerolineales bacterium]
MESLLQQGINAAKAGDKARAFQLLTRATQDNTTAEKAWLWLAGVVTVDAERLFCLDNALRINPNNEPAKNKAAEFRQKGIFPAAPTPPRFVSQTDSPSAQAVTPKSMASSPAASMDLKPPQPKAVEPLHRAVTNSQQDLSGLFRFAAQELARKQSPKVVAQKLTDQGVTPAAANQIVVETQKVIKKALAEKNKKRMTRGLIWAVIGIVLTCGTMAIASKGGGRYVLFYGAVIYGIIDFIAGLIGWLSNR